MLCNNYYTITAISNLIIYGEIALNRNPSFGHVRQIFTRYSVETDGDTDT